jgi:tetratricopeptide (TPR) repeat protein
VSVDNSSETSADVTDVDTPSADAITNRGNEFYEQGQYDSAMVYYDKVLLKDPSNQFAQYNKGLVYYSQKNYNRSVPTMLRCVREHPDYGEAYWLLGSNYYDRQRLDSARICFDRAYEKGVRNGGFLQLLASLYEPADRAKAIGLYQESLQQDSSLVDSYRKLIVLESGRAAEYQSKMKKWTKAN